ncbi:MAG: exosome complex protein Rrp42 [Nanoarchaeota archaeon]|nr:exosome complex protein Rrp42 [Nanoarchaeota archaeon]
MTNETYIKKLIEDGSRIDKRSFDEFREVTIEKGVIKTAEGSARVKIGNTHVIAGIKMSVGTPFPDTPDEGILIVNTELSPIASPKFETGPPSEDSIEIARVIDRGIRECKAIDLGKMCIVPGEKVWVINVDIHVLDHDGNLIDAGGLAAVAALLDAKIPKYDVETEKVIKDETIGSIPIVDTPIPVTITKIADQLLLDTSVEEEEAMDARITIASTKNGSLCAMQKSGKGYLTTVELEKAVDWSIKKGEELRALLT